MNSNIVLAKINTPDNRNAGNFFKIRGFPTLKLISNGDLSNPIDFSGKTEEKIISSLIRKT
jgi:hypothetical protein